jgi:D-glycero-D-manno-heptose 1,7-bisphosphate phosphatase
MIHPALFLDRDGVIVENYADYVLKEDDLFFLPGARSALAAVSVLPIKIIVVTNQSPVNRGLVTHEKMDEIHARMVAEIEVRGGRIDGIYYCPHRPDEGCTCRKPEPGLLIQAARAHQIGLEQSIMIGDALSDLQAGQRAGVPQTILLETGRGLDQRGQRHPADLKPYALYPDLAAAIYDLFPEIEPK